MSGGEREIGESLGTLPQRWLLLLRRSPGRQACARAALWAVLTLAAALLIYWGHGEHQKRTLPNIVATLAQDASARLQDALRSEIDESEGDAATGQRLEQHAIAVDQFLIKLRDMHTEAIPEFAAAADDYDDRSELTGFYTLKMDDATKWQFYATKGLSDGSPDWGGGITVSHAF